MKISAIINSHAKNCCVTLVDNIYYINITAKPIKGKANDMIIKLLANHFNISQSQITIVKGQKSKNKIIEITN